MKDIIVREPNVFATARFDEKFKMNELRIFQYVISQINENFEQVSISPGFLIKLFKLKGNKFYSTMKLISEKILQKIMFIEDGKSFKAFSVYSYCTYNDEKKQYQIKLSEELKPYLCGEKGKYFKYYISNIVALKNKNMINIYRYLCKTLPANKNYFELKINIDLFRKNLNLENSYKEFKLLKGFLLTKAKKEITEKTDLIFDFECIRNEQDKRKVKYILLKIKRKDKEKKVLAKNKKESYEVNICKTCKTILSKYTLKCPRCEE